MSGMFERPGAQYGWIGNVAARIALLAVAAFTWLVFPPQASAQNVTVTVYTLPAGATYMVDNLIYTDQATFSWPAGSQHYLSVGTYLVQPAPPAPPQFTFVDWTDAQGVVSNLAGIWIAASADATYYVANFTNTKTLTATVSLTCAPVSCGTVPGLILLSGSPYTGNPAYPPGVTPEPYGTQLALTAVANSGYVFSSWSPGSNQVISGNTDNVTMDGNVTAVANFLLAVPITFASVPSGLQLLVDGGTTMTPDTLGLGWGTSHYLSAISPQRDASNNFWVFSSWSDSGAINHTYTVPQSAAPVTLTVTYTPAEVSTFLFSPPNAGLSLVVDGRSNYTDWNFAWATGTTHTFSAPATQTDPQGNLWGFVGWSNGGPETQTLIVGTTGGTYTANYQQLGQLTVNSSYPGVSVSVNGTSCTTPCTVQPPLGTSLTIGAPATVQVGVGSQQRLLGWSNGTGPGNLTLAAPAKATTVTANYQLMNQLATATSPANEGNWSLQPSSPDGYYNSGTTVNISLSPAAGYQFHEWVGDLTGIEPFGTVVLSQPRVVTALLTAVPYLSTGAVTNGAGPTPSSAVAPGSAISIFGVNLTATTQEGTVSPMPQTLGGLTVAVGSRLLPLFFVSPGQVNAQLPADLPVGASSLVVTTADQAPVTANFTIAQDAPGLFSLTSNNNAYALAFHANGTLITEASPAKAGETITLFGTGFGPTTPARPEGLAIPSSPSFVVKDPASVQVGTASFTASSAYALPGAVGIDVVQFALGTGAPSGGDYQVTVTVNSVVSNTVLLPIQ